MKLQLIALLCCATSVYAVPSFSQTARLDVNYNSRSIVSALSDIKARTGYSFVYRAGLIPQSARTTVSMADASLESVLNEVLVKNGFDYSIEGTTVVVSRAAQQPQQSVGQASGTVRDMSGQPVPGVSVMVKGTTTGTSTDANGAFSLRAARGATLEFSAVGMESQEVVWRDQALNIIMAEQVEQLEEVVVTGMVVTDKRMFTGASDKLNASEVMISGLPEVSRSLEGRSAGVTVQNVSGTFGAAPKIRIRGATSIYGNSKPLWVVDGVVMEDITEVSADDLSSGNVETLISSAVAGLNADDIESFQILKDGSATSIYGARAMAGVIVITTKRGKAGTSRISYSGELTMRQTPSYSQFDIMNSQEQMAVYQEMYDKGWLRFAGTWRASNYGVYGKMYELNNTFDPVSGSYALSARPEVRNAYLQQAEYRNTDWFKELFHLSLQQTHSVSITSGNDKSTFYGSMSLMEDPGWTTRSHVRRMTVNTNFGHKITDNLTATLISTGSYRKQEAPGSQSTTTDSHNGTVSRAFDINPYKYALTTSRTLDPNLYYRRNYAPFNIFDELENNYVDLNVMDLKFQGELKWVIMPGLDVSLLGAMKYSTSNTKYHVLDGSNQANAYRVMDDYQILSSNGYLYSDPAKPFDYPISVLPEGGFMNKGTNEMLGYDFRASMNWRKSFGEHYTSFYGGVETNAVDRYSDSFQAWGLQYSLGEISFWPYEYFKQLKEKGSTYYSLSNTKGRNVAFFGLVTYQLKGKYTLNGTFRYEGSNQLGRSRQARWLPTWNIAGRWNVYDEKFFEPLHKVFSNLNFRASYSLTADKVPSHVRNSKVLISSNTPYRPQISSQETGLQISALENSELTYEKKHEINLGLDFGVLNDRISVAMDVYRRDQFDLIGAVYTQGTGGFSSRNANVASLKSQGVEFSISSVNLKREKNRFSWESSFIFAHSTNEITDLNSSPTVLSMIRGTGYPMKGRPVRSLYSLNFVGLTDDGVPIIINPTTGLPSSSDVPFSSTAWKEEWLKYEGPSEPTTTGSFGNTLKWRNFNLNLFVTFSFGNVVRLDEAFYSSYSDLTANSRMLADRWMVPGDELKTNIPAILSSRQINKSSTALAKMYQGYNYTDIRMADGGFVRMKEISLQYDVPKRLVQSWGFGAVSLKGQVTNPFLIWYDRETLKGQDPEFVSSGGVAMPVPRQFTLTLKATL